MQADGTRAWAAAALWALAAAAASAQPAPKVRIELAPETAGAAPGGTIHVALKQTIEPGWHTYWRNPGDSGEPTRIRWTLPAGWTAGDIVWPTPERQPAPGGLMNYGYSRQVLLPVPITVPASARVGDTLTLRADASWLVCKDVCIPEQGTAEASLPVVAGTPRPHPEHGRAVSRALAAAPKPSGLAAAFARTDGGLKLAVTGPELAGADLAGAYFFPFDGQAVTHSAAQAVERGPDGATLLLEPGYGFQAPQPPARLDGVLVLADGQAWEIDAASGPLPAGAAGLGPPSARTAEEGGLTLPLAVAFAFLGGLILNLMPCVFPVLGIKAAALAGHAHDRRAARVQGVAFGAGVVTTFLLLAGALIGLRAAGQAVGWGFQLQSPAVVAALSLLFLLIGLNLSGVFEVGGSVQNLGSGATRGSGAAGAFGTGALAVVAAAPCTAPFMAGAMGYALTQSAPVSLLVFLALALGFALPFVLLSVSPRLLERLPRPGPWMAALRRWLALPMFAAAAWLAWVLSRQQGWPALGVLLAGALGLLGVAALFGRAQRAEAAPAWRRPALAGVAALIFGGAAVAAAAPPVTGAGAPSGAATPRLSGDAFSPERLAALRAEGRPVFVNLTADWCVTCKVNERTALASRRVADAFRDTGVVYLEGDWTKRDAVIARTLAEHGRQGVPLYLLYTPGEERPQILPQLLTEGAVVKALERAARTETAAKES